ncbi:MAG: hypothetical protein ABIP09_03945 [Gemmatimonadaceae bacterium]
MPDKKRERFYLDRLVECSLGLPSGEPVESERPDFIYGELPRRVGVAITLFHLPPRPSEQPHQEAQSLHDRIVERAAELHDVAGGPALYVDVHFRSNRISKRAVPGIAQALATVVLRYARPTGVVIPALEIPVEELPREIAAVQVRGSIDDRDRLWDSGGGGWVAPVTAEHIQCELNRKDHVVDAARGRCDELWLAIVQDWFSGAAPVELSEAALSSGYVHRFTKALWLDFHGSKAIEFKMSAASPCVAAVEGGSVGSE